MARRRSHPPTAPIAARPAIAGKLLTVWRAQHFHAGTDMHVFVWPGEWPATHAREVDAVPVHEDKVTGGPGGILVTGRVPNDAIRFAYGYAFAGAATMPPSRLAVVTFYGQLDSGPDITVWMHRDQDGVPTFTVPRGWKPVGLDRPDHT